MILGQYDLNPENSRFFARALSGCLRIGPTLAFKIFRGISDAAEAGMGLFSVDQSETAYVGFKFQAQFFLRSDSSPRLGLFGDEIEPVFVSARAACRALKNTSPNKITRLQLRISCEFIEFMFFWKSGVISCRRFPAITAGFQISRAFGFDEEPNSWAMLSFSPRYLHGLLTFIPDSTEKLMLTFFRDSERTLTISNSFPPSSDSSSNVQMQLSQSELNRNGSYFSNQYREGSKFSIPINEIKCITNILCEDSEVDTAGNMSFGFVGSLDARNNSQILQIKGCSNRFYSTSIIYKGSSSEGVVLASQTSTERNRTRDHIQDTHFSGTLVNLSGADVTEDTLLAHAAEVIDPIDLEMPYNPDPFISFSDTTFIQTPASDSNAEPSLPSKTTDSNRKDNSCRITEWDNEVPSTPVHTVDVGVFDDLWL